MFESLADFVAAVRGVVMLKSPIRAVVDINEQGEVVESRPHPETSVSLLMKMKDVDFAESSFSFRDSERINVTVPCAGNSISMTLS